MIWLVASRQVLTGQSSNFRKTCGILPRKSQTRVRFLSFVLMPAMLILDSRSQWLGEKNLGSIQLADAKSISGLICQIFFQSRKEVTND